ncbi:hypothetical protein DER45DRAFT_599946 [Fusarium avenaceum]|nr:hypothetical protein DER45DRAFT_599946 [Fusarium avenaceum]
MSALSTPPTSPGRESTIPSYCAGLSLELNITQSYTNTLTEHTITAQVTSLITETMSPVMHVNLITAQGPTAAVLKLYDRRFGTHLREIRGKYVPCRSEDEVAFEQFVRKGAMGSFIDEIKEDFRTQPLPSTAEDWREGPDAEARFEGALWYEANKQFSNETRAYTRLKDLQGIMIPRLYAQVRVASKDNCNADYNEYMSVKGILLQAIPGCNLWDFAKSPSSPQSHQKWTCIVQKAVDAAHEINKNDVILDDSGPRNVVVDKATHTSFIVDLAQCTFKNDMFQLWEAEGFDSDSEEEEENGDDRNLEVEWWSRIRARENPASIGLLMTKRLLKTHGLKLEFQYPDYQQLLDAAKVSAASPGVPRADEKSEKNTKQ